MAVVSDILVLFFTWKSTAFMWKAERAGVHGLTLIVILRDGKFGHFHCHLTRKLTLVSSTRQAPYILRTSTRMVSNRIRINTILQRTTRLERRQPDP